MNKNTAYIFCVGRELLEGLVLDRNACFMAGKLSEIGLRVIGIQVLDPTDESMVEAFRQVIARAPTYVFTTGGMGPGHDDTTRACLAKAAGLALHTDPQAADMVAKSYRRLFAKGTVDRAELNEDRMKMAQVPVGSTCYENPLGAAPALRLRVKDTVLFLLPGLPEELQHMFTLHVCPAVKADGIRIHKSSRHIDFPGRDESALSRLLADLSRRYPEVRAKARPQTAAEGSGIRITIYGEHPDAEALDRLLDRVEADSRARLGLETQVDRRPKEH